MYEADDTALIRRHVRDIKLRGLSLGYSGSQLLGGMIGRSLRLNGVSLIGCGLNDRMLKAMVDDVKYKKVDVSFALLFINQVPYFYVFRVLK